MSQELSCAVFPITSSEKSEYDKPLGTGFVVGEKDGEYYLITCWHVVNDIGPDNLRIGKLQCELVSEPGDNVFDLALIKVSSLPLNENEEVNILSISNPSTEKLINERLRKKETSNVNFLTYGYYKGKQIDGEPKSGRIIKTKTIHYKSGDNKKIGKNIKSYNWNIKIDDIADFKAIIENGNSGAPVIESNQVVAVITDKEEDIDNQGVAIRVSHIKDVLSKKVYSELTFLQNKVTHIRKSVKKLPIGIKDPGSIKDQYVYRARFQPFCRDHYEAIQGFWRRYVKPKVEYGKENPKADYNKEGKSEADIAYETDCAPELYLWVVKSLSTTAYNMGKIKADDMGKAFFRHLSFFNPLDYMLCSKVIRKDLFYFIDKDLEKYTNSRNDLNAFKKWAESHLHIVSIPFSINEIVLYWGAENGLIYKNKLTKPNWGNSKFIEIFSKMYSETYDVLTDFDKKVPDEDHYYSGQPVSEIALNLATRFKDTSSENMPSMFLPVFDTQDLSDIRSMEGCDWKSEVCYLPWLNQKFDDDDTSKFERYFTTQLKSIANVNLCAQNAFVYYVYLKLIDNNKIDVKVDDLANKLVELVVFLKERSTKNTVALFIDKVDEQIEKINKKNLDENGKLSGAKNVVIQSLDNLELPQKSLKTYHPINTITDEI